MIHTSHSSHETLKKIIVALDHMERAEVENFLRTHGHHFSYIKIGLELFLKYGPSIVRELSETYQKKIFLDLKLHDIPATVGKAISSLEGLPIAFLTVHLSGGREMLKSAVEAKNQYIPYCQLLGVSFLTSLSDFDLNEMFGIKNFNEAFLKLSQLANQCGIDGLVSSPHEVPELKKHFPKLISVTPGIRFEDEIKSGNTQDQRRVMGPKDALSAGADFLVIGRSITQAIHLDDRLSSL